MTALGGAGDVSERHTEVAGGAIRSWSGGEGPPVVVLHHSFGNPGWLPFHRELSERCTVVAPDLPGFRRVGAAGLGPPPSGPRPADGLVATRPGPRAGDPGRLRVRGMGGRGAEHHEPGAAGRPGPGGAGGALAEGRADPRPDPGVALRVRAQRVRRPEGLRIRLRRRPHRRPPAGLGPEPRDDHPGGVEAVHVQPSAAAAPGARARADPAWWRRTPTIASPHGPAADNTPRSCRRARLEIVPHCGHAVDMEQPSVLAGHVAGHVPGAP